MVSLQISTVAGICKMAKKTRSNKQEAVEVAPPVLGKLLVEGLYWGESWALQDFKTLREQVEDEVAEGDVQQVWFPLMLAERVSSRLRDNIIVYAWNSRFLLAALIGYASALLRNLIDMVSAQNLRDSGIKLPRGYRKAAEECAQVFDLMVGAMHDVAASSVANTSIFSLEDSEFLFERLRGMVDQLVRLLKVLGYSDSEKLVHSLRASRDVLGDAFDTEQVTDVLTASFLPGTTALLECVTHREGE